MAISLRQLPGLMTAQAERPAPGDRGGAFLARLVAEPQSLRTKLSLKETTSTSAS